MGLFSEALNAAKVPAAQPVTPAKPTVASTGGLFSQIYKGGSPTIVTPKTLTTPATPKTTAVKSPNAEASLTPDIPANALKGSLGGGYGASSITDQYSGKPLLTFENPVARSSQLFSNRVAPKFDPTVPQKIDPAVLHNDRMPESASQAVKKATGAAPDTNLDHLISLELGGSNDTSNLNNEDLQKNGTQPSLSLENQTAKDVASGKISYVDGQKIIARAKGVKLSDDTSFDTSSHPLATDYAKPAPNQTGTQSQQPNIFQKIGSGIANFAKAYVKPNSADNTVKNAASSGAENLITNSPPFKALTTALAGDGIKATIKAAGFDLGHGLKLNAADIDKATARVNALVKGGMSKSEAAKKAISEVTDTKLKAQVLASTAPGEDLVAEDVLNSLSKETDLGKITTLLKSKGVDEDAATALSPILSKANTPEAVKAILQTAAEHGMLYKAAAEGTTAADEFAAQEAGKGEDGESVPEPKEIAPSESEEQPKALPQSDRVSDIPAGEEVPQPKEKVPVIRDDQEAQDEAVVKTEANPGRHLDPVNNLDKDTGKIYKDWVNQAGESNTAISGKIASKPFETLRGDGMDAVHKFQAGDRNGQLADVEKWGKDLLSKEQAAGVPTEPRENYLPQYWANSKSEILAAQKKYLGENTGKNVNLRPSFTKEAVFPDYATGEQNGLTPKYDNIPDMINARVRASEKSIADRKFFDNLASRGLIQPRAGDGWKNLDPDHFPQYAVQGHDGEIYRGALKAPAALADLINNQLKGPESLSDRFFAWTAKGSTFLKGVVLSAGVPGTAINMHGFNELAATVPELFNQPSLFMNALKYLFYPKAGGNFLEANLAMAKEAALSGLVLGSEDQTLGKVAEAAIIKSPLSKATDIIKKGRDLLYSTFAKHDFEQMIPALKLQMWQSTKEFLMEGGMSAEDAAEEASKRANNTFGGINYAALGRDKNLQNLLRSAVFAPDFWESRFRYAGGMGKSVVGKGASAGLYRKAVIAVIGAYIGMNIANKVKSGKWMFQNPAGHSMDILAGKDSAGKNIWIRPFGTDLDFVRLPLDIATALTQGDSSSVSTLLRDRVSSLIQPVVSYLSNSDAYGNKIFGPSTTADPASAQWMSYLSQLPIVPSVGSGLAGLLDKNQSKAQSLAEALSLPVRFNSATTPSVSTIADLIYTQRPALEKQIKADYLSGNTDDAMAKMSAYNKQLLQATIQAYQDNGYKVTDQKAFTQFLLTNSEAKGGLKGLFLTPPTQKTLDTASQKAGQPLFNKIFPSTITPGQ